MSSKQFSKLSKSSNSTEYQTPKSFFDKLNRIFKFEYDPCTTEDNPLDLMVYTTKEEDGLKTSWNYNTFVNPPFGKGIHDWIKKMNMESEDFTNVYAMLLPSRTETKYFQELIWKIGSSVYFIKGRLKFVNPVLNGKEQPHIIGSMLWLRNATIDQKEQLKESIPGVLIENE